MKKILLIGENSYIGGAFKSFADEKYDIKILSSRNNAWKSFDFSRYDSILYCAGIAHVKQNKKIEYYKINCDLAVDIAVKAKDSGVNQFIFLSSMAVYGTAKAEIDKYSMPNPDKVDLYGGSKLKAEQELQKLVGFKLCIVRPPMVYGRGCKGNFPKLVKLAKICPVFPDFNNKRSMIYIDNLCNFICDLIDSGRSGIFMPQNSEYVSTAELVKLINRRIIMIKLFNPFIRLLNKRVSVFNKLFGDLYYKQTESTSEIVGFKESVRLSIIAEE